MTYPFVPSPPSETWPRNAPIKAIAIHIAEGGGTVSWLQRPDGNSSHYVVERTGRIVQMVRESMAAGSINPLKVRRDDDQAFTYLGEAVRYGVTANKAALGEHWNNPNAAVIAIEVEGFARIGPNSAQRGSLRTLVMDIRRRHPGLPTLGHRDFQNYKACPGKLIPWVDYGGHGVQPEEDDEMLTFTLERETGDVVVTIDGASAIRLDDGELIPVHKDETKEAMAFGKLAKPFGSGTGAQADRQSGYLLFGPRPAWLLAYAAREVPTTGGDTKRFVAIAVDGVIDKSTEILV